MRAIQVTRLDGPAAVAVVEVPEPAASPTAVVIDVAAAGITFPDTLLTRGQYQYRPEPPFTLGCEVAGTVREAPEGSGVRPGDRVAAFSAFGGFADVVAVEPAQVFALPDAVGFAAGAALPMNYLTMQFALARRARLAEGETVLVHGAAGGIGTAAVQLAKAMGATTIGVASSAAKREFVAGLGADHVIDVADFSAPPSPTSPTAAESTSSLIRWAATGSPTRCAA